MFKLIQAEEKHLEKITPLLMDTGYWYAGLKNNSLDLSSYEAMRDFIIRPMLSFTTLAVDIRHDNQILGVIVCSSKKELEGVSAEDSSGKKFEYHPRIIELFKNSMEFEINDSYHVSFLAVDKQWRRQGIGTALLQHAETKAKKLGMNNLSVYTVSCQVSSILLYLKFGMMISKIVTMSEEVPFPYFLYLEKTPELEAKRDYFDTPDYQNLNLFELEV